MKSIEEEIATWINGRPDWQRILASRILSGEAVDNEYAASIASLLVKGETLPEVQQINPGDLPTASSAGEAVVLSSISDLVNVNALAGEASIEFAESGLTVIYGDNGSGKSGFARLVKEAVGARHEQAILPNAFDVDAPTEQGAKIKYRLGQEARELSWPHGEDPILRKVHFYDEACGDHYLSSDSELSYRPSALNVLDRLIAATELLQFAIDAELEKVEASPYQVPGLDSTSSAAVFMISFDADTTDAQLELACEVQKGAEVELADLVQKESKLLASNPAKEESRLNSLADSLDLVQQHLQVLEESISPAAAKALEGQQVSAVAARAAADLASEVDFKEEPLSGVGSETWRALWNAAELYAQHEAYHDKDEFPYLGADARCPLCHQELDEGASERLGRFRDFVRDQTEKNASEKEAEYKSSVNALDDIVAVTVPVTGALAKIEA